MLGFLRLFLHPITSIAVVVSIVPAIAVTVVAALLLSLLLFLLSLLLLLVEYRCMYLLLEDVFELQSER